MPEYGQPVDADEEARKRKAAENPLVQYFSGQPQAMDPAPQRTPVGPAAPAAAPTNTGAGANTGAAAQQRPAPTNFTNFSRVQSANRDVSRREGRAYEQRGMTKAAMAGQSLDKLRARFGDQSAAGTVAGVPGSAPVAAGQVETGASDPGAAVMVRDANGTWQRVTQDGASQTGETSAAAYANADGSYSGPGGLGDIEGADDTYAATLAAQQNLNALGDDAGGMQALIQEQNPNGTAGTSKLSAGLIGSANRGNFDALRARFTPEADIAKAELDAAAQAKAAGDTSMKNAADWRARGDQLKGSEDAYAASMEEQKKGREDAAKGKLSEAEFEKQWEEAQRSSFGDEANLAFNEFNKVMSPVNWFTEAAGVRDPTQDYLTKNIHGKDGQRSGSTSGVKIQWRPEDKAVYRQMTPEQWAFLNGKTPTMQRLWIKMRGDQLAQRGAFAPGLRPPPGWENGTGVS